MRTRAPVTDSTGSYSLGVISNTVWHVGAAFETPSQFWVGRARVVMGSGDAVQDLELRGPFPKPAPVAVTFDASQPQRVVLADGTYIYIPAGAMLVEGQVTLRIVPIATLPHQHHARLYKYGYAFYATDAAGQQIEESFNQDVIIGFRYSEAELVALGLFEPLLKPMYYSTTTDQWIHPDSYAVDIARNLVTMQIDHFTDFCLSGEPAERVHLPTITRQ